MRRQYFEDWKSNLIANYLSRLKNNVHSVFERLSIEQKILWRERSSSELAGPGHLQLIFYILFWVDLITEIISLKQVIGFHPFYNFYWLSPFL